MVTAYLHCALGLKFFDGGTKEFATDGGLGGRMLLIDMFGGAGDMH